MPHWRSMIEKDFLGAWDLVDDKMQPKDFTLKITKVEAKILKTQQNPKGKRKCTITFERAQKGMVANSTNCGIIEATDGSASASRSTRAT